MWKKKICRIDVTAQEIKWDIAQCGCVSQHGCILHGNMLCKLLLSGRQIDAHGGHSLVV